MRRLLILFSALSALNAERPPRIEFTAIQSFNRPYAQFYRRYLGCPTEGKWSEEQCYPQVGYDDLESFRQAREAAKVLFGLH
jgi:hypothetical protein